MPQNTSWQSERGGSNRPLHGGGGGQPPRQPPRINVPVSRIVFGQDIDRKLYSEIAEKTAEAVGDEGKKNRTNKPAQLRRFYDELVALQEKIRSDQNQFKQHEPFIQMLKAKVAYAKGRGVVNDEFVSLLNRVVDQARDPTTLKQARLFMEAFMAFYKVHGPREG
jgi:CRISPR-associated protein Csm2